MYIRISGKYLKIQGNIINFKEYMQYIKRGKKWRDFWHVMLFLIMINTDNIYNLL